MTMKIVSILYLFWHAFIVDDATFIVSDLTGKIYGGIHTLSPSRYEIVTS